MEAGIVMIGADVRNVEAGVKNMWGVGSGDIVGVRVEDIDEVEAGVYVVEASIFVMV